MACVSSPILDLYFSRRKIQIIMENKDMLRGNVIIGAYFMDRKPGIIHVGGRFKEDHIMLMDSAFGKRPILFCLERWKIIIFGKIQRKASQLWISRWKYPNLVGNS